MKIKKLRLKNGYKRFHDLTIDLGETSKRFVILVGPNGCGKSSVLDGIMYRASIHGQIGSTGNKDYRYHSMHQNPSFSYENVVIDFEIGSFSPVFEEKSKLGQARTLFSFRSPYRYNSHLMIGQISAIQDIKNNQHGASATSDIDTRIEGNYRALLAKYSKLRDGEDLRPSEAKQHIIGELNSSIQRCLNLTIESIGDVESNQGTLYFKKPDNKQNFEFNVLSSGEKEVIDLLLDLYLRADHYTDTVFLFDEPELHINTSIQKNLLLEINKLVGKNCQIWISTHSIGFLRAIQEEFYDDCQIIQFKENMNLASQPYILTPEKMSFLKWRELFSIALDDLTFLLSPKRIVYCEGRDQPDKMSQERGLDAQVYNNIFSEEYNDTLFVSSGGNTELDQRSTIAFLIMSKVLSDLEILVFKDRDISSGKFTTEEDRLRYLSLNPDNHRVMKRWEIENYLFDKEVLKKYCIEQKLIFDEVNYDLFVTDIMNQSIKDEFHRIKNFCGITTSTSPDKFKIELSKYITKDMLLYQELKDCIFNGA